MKIVAALALILLLTACTVSDDDYESSVRVCTNQEAWDNRADYEAQTCIFISDGFKEDGTYWKKYNCHLDTWVLNESGVWVQNRTSFACKDTRQRRDV